MRATGSTLQWLSGLLIVGVITVAALRFPFIWDTVYHSSVAGDMFASGLGNLIPPQSADNGNPVLYPLLLMLTWIVGGQSLAAGHLFFALILLSLFAGVIKLAARFVEASLLWFVPFLIWSDPTLLTQSILMGYDVLLLSLLVWGMVFIIEKRWFGLALVMVAMVLVHYRGAVGVAFLFIVQASLGGKFTFRKALWFIAPLLAFAGWQFYHYLETGWYLFSADNAGSMGGVGVEQWFRNATYAFWRAADLGRVGVWAIVIVLMIRNRKQLDPDDRVLLLLALSPILIHILAFAHTQLPVSQRYFMASAIIIIVLLLRLCRFAAPGLKRLTVAAATIFLLSGNLWFYPQRFGNAWDASLICLTWPRVEQAADMEIKRQGLARSDIAAQYPLTYRPADSYLNNDTVAFIDLGQSEPDSFRYIFYSNFSNMYPPATLARLKSEWEEVWHVRRGRIEAGLFKNPRDH